MYGKNFNLLIPILEARIYWDFNYEKKQHIMFIFAVEWNFISVTFVGRV